MIKARKQKIVAYFRMSTEDQQNSIERQRITYHTFLKNNPDKYESLGEYTEEGKSGDASVERPVQKRLLDLLETKELHTDYLWVSESSRWGRFNTNYKYKFVLPLKKAGVKLLTNTQEIDFSKPESDLLYDVSQSMSYIENHQRAERVVSGIAVLVEQKKFPLNPCYGLKREGKVKLVKDEYQSRIVELIFHKYLETQSLNRTVYYLNNELQEPPPRSKTWSIPTVKTILKNPKLAGFYTYGRKSAGKIFTYDKSPLPKQREEDEKGKHINNDDYFMEYAPEIVEPVIDLKTWQDAQEILINKTRYGGRWGAGKKKESAKYVGTLVCRCGRRVTGRKRKPFVAYDCVVGRAGGCCGTSHLEPVIDAAILPTIKSLADKNKVYEYLFKDKYCSDTQKEYLNNIKAKYKVGITRATELDGLLPDGFTENLRNLKREIDILERKTQETWKEEDIQQEAEIIAGFYQNLIGNRKESDILSREFVRDYIDRIQLSLARVRSVQGKKSWTAIEKVTIRCSLGKRVTEVRTEHRCLPRLKDEDSLTVEISVPLPPKFAACEPEPYDDSKVL